MWSCLVITEKLLAVLGSIYLGLTLGFLIGYFLYKRKP
jgi:uncharacterized protein YneF (UPF0154 family)